MKNRFLMTVSVAALTLVAACSEPAEVRTDFSDQASAVIAAEYGDEFASNALLAEWQGP